MKSRKFQPKHQIQRIFDQLEAFCESRDRRELLKGIRFLRANFPENERALNRCLDWCWRAGMHQEGLRLAAPSLEEISGRGNHDEIHSLGSERAIFYLTFLATQSGLPWVRRWLLRDEPLLLTSTKNHLLVANLWIACREFERAETRLKKYQQELRKDLSASGIESSRTVHMTLVHLHYQTARYDLAEASCERALALIDRKTSPLLFLDAESQRLLCRAHQRAPDAALEAHECLVSEFHNLRESAPRLHAALAARRALLLALSGNKPAARAQMDFTDQLLHDSLPEYSPMRRVAFLQEMAPHGILTPSEWLTLTHYPDSPWDPRRHSRLRPPPTTIDSPSPLEISARLPRSHFRISSNADEYQIGPKRFHFGIPKEIQLLALLQRSHPFGIHRNLAMALLWPDQGRLIRALEPRLAQLIQRLRNTHRFVIHVERETLSLSEAGVERVFVDLESKTPLAPALEIPAPLTPAWIARAYGLGLTQARKCLQQWEERGWVRTEGAGSRKTYRLTFSLITI